MALGYTTYKTPNAIYTIGSDLTGKEGCGVSIPSGEQGKVVVATATTDVPYGIVIVGGPSEDGQYPGLVAQASVELVDQLGCCVQVTVTSQTSVTAGEFLLIDSADADGTFIGTNSFTPALGDWLWGYALTNAQPGEQCLMRFQPQYFFSTYVPPVP